MQTRSLGQTGLELTTVGLGTWAIGGGQWQYGWGSQDTREAVAAIERAVDLGINWIDTAAVYGDGQSERLVGDALRHIDPARCPLIATKCGRVFDARRKVIGKLKADSIEAECEASLRRLGRDTIDLYQMHWPDPDSDIEEGWQAMVDLVDAGKVRQIGVSNFNVAQLQRIQPIYPVASLQPPYNMLVRGVEGELLDYCAACKIGVVAYSPMGKGLLTGAITVARAGALGGDDHRSRDPRFQEPQLGAHLQLVDGLRAVAARRGCNLAQLAIAWVLRRPEVTSAIVGARRPEQIEQTAQAGDLTLDQRDLELVDGLLLQHTAALAELRSA